MPFVVWLGVGRAVSGLEGASFPRQEFPHPTFLPPSFQTWGIPQTLCARRELALPVASKAGIVPLWELLTRRRTQTLIK